MIVDPGELRDATSFRVERIAAGVRYMTTPSQIQHVGWAASCFALTSASRSD